MGDTIAPEEGKFYRDRSGNVRGPMKHVGGGWIDDERIDLYDDFDWYDTGRYSHTGGTHKFDLITELREVTPTSVIVGISKSGPIREVVKTELQLVPGDYGRFRVISESDGDVYIGFLNAADERAESIWIDAEELRDAADMFNKIADYLDGNSK